MIPILWIRYTCPNAVIVSKIVPLTKLLLFLEPQNVTSSFTSACHPMDCKLRKFSLIS